MTSGLWRFIQQQIEAGNKTMLMLVASRQGSSPGRQGFKMAVSSSGELLGSIGGGVMEYNMVEQARSLLSDPSFSAATKRQVHIPGSGPERSGLICSGEQTHVFFLLEQQHASIVLSLAEAEESGETGWLEISPGRIGFYTEPIHQESILWEQTDKDQWAYREAIGVKPQLYIFGGGHLSLPLSMLGRMLGFQVDVLDDRRDLNTMLANVHAHRLDVIDYHQAARYIRHPQNAYVAIMTASHAADQLILGQMLALPLKYLGMIGSRKKVEKIFQNLRLSGATDDQLSRVDSPMGLPIGAQTIQEIGISIMAKIVKVRNQG